MVQVPLPPIRQAEQHPNATDPNATVGSLATLQPPPSGLFKPAGQDALAAFAPPPPLTLPSVAQSAPADRMSGLGLTIGYAQMPEIVEDKPPPEPVVQKFEDLHPHTQFEVRRGYRETHPNKKFFPEQWTPPPEEPREPGKARLSREAPLPTEPEPVDLSKLPPKTIKEMLAGKAKLNKVATDYAAVIEIQKRKAAADVEAGKPPSPQALNYRE